MNEKIKNPAPIVEKQDKIPTIIKLAQENKHFGVPKHIENDGNFNIGDRNSGNFNIGDRNSGNCNIGGRNSGDYNSGVRNSGDYNIGNWNSGDFNSGDFNSGNCNNGNRNSGNYNDGNRNSGDYNKCDFSNGCFNTVEPKIYLFNKPSEWTYSDWLDSKAYDLLSEMPCNTLEYVKFGNMTEEEKAENPEAKTTDGYLKKIDNSESVIAWWHKLSDTEKKIITSLPNFDKEIFEETTGIDVDVLSLMEANED